mmetsp:Transcript_2439/g.2821  ORF Transcript_2439/g.2821 Transcript_2439/m.2821 type:complete len:218 (+) Transcript_2439:218-871(+)
MRCVRYLVFVQHRAHLAASSLFVVLSLLEVKSLSWRRPSLSVCDKSVFDGPCDSNKGLIDVDIVLGRALPEIDAKLLGKFLSLFRGDDLLVKHIALVSDEDLVDMDVGVLLDLRDPVANGFEGATVSHVVDEQNALCPAEVRCGDCAEAFLSCCIPDLKLDACAVNIDILDLEVNANRGDECGGKGVVGVTQQKTSLTDSGISNHQQLDLHIVRGAT